MIHHMTWTDDEYLATSEICSNFFSISAGVFSERHGVFDGGHS